MTEEERPPARALIEQFWEKVIAIELVALLVVGILYSLNNRRPIEIGFIALKFPTLLGPAAFSLVLTITAYLTGMAMGFPLGWLRTSRRRFVRGPATVWVEALRGTPLFVQLLFLFAVFSLYNPGDLPTDQRVLVTGFLALTLNTGAYQAEIFRGGLQSVHVGQVEAAKAVGLSYWRSMRRVILPQAIRIVVPPLTNEFIALLKASALLFFIGVQELTYEGRLLSFGGHFVEVYIMVTSLYLAMAVPLALGIGYLERRFRIPGLGMQQERTARARAPAKGVVARTFGIETTRLRNLLTRPAVVPAAHGEDVRGGRGGHRQEAGPDRRPGVRAPLPP